MKKSLIIGAASLAIAAIPVVSTFAVGPGSYPQDVTVGEVDETIYSVDINWGDMTFDWKYDEVTNKYDFKTHLGCEGYVAGADALTPAKDDGRLYSDSTCSTLQTSDLVNGTTYYQKTKVGGEVRVVDNSTNGKIKAQASFTAEDDYSWVIGKFSDTYTLTLNTGEIEYGEDLADGLLPIQQGLDIKAYDGYLHLEKDDQQAPNLVSASDKIGTVTLTISPDTTPIEN